MGLPKFIVALSADERMQLRTLVRRGTASARRLTRARVLLKADEELTDVAVLKRSASGSPPSTGFGNAV